MRKSNNNKDVVKKTGNFEFPDDIDEFETTPTKESDPIPSPLCRTSTASDKRVTKKTKFASDNEYDNDADDQLEEEWGSQTEVRPME